MDNSTSPRKRKRPSYLTEDFIDSDTITDSDEETKPDNKQADTKDDNKPKCFLCEKLGTDSTCSITDTIGTTPFTFTDVLRKLFKKEQLPAQLTKKDFSTGLLCSGCKDLVDELFRLQHELRGVKNEIVDTFKRSVKSKKKNKEEKPLEVKPEEAPVKKKEKKKENKKEEAVDEPIDDVYIIEMLKEKQGNKYLVKWENYGEEENTWEPKSSIPDHIIKYYEENLTRLGTAAPATLVVLPEENEEEFEVEQILEKKVIKGKNVEYLVKWKNYDDPDDNTWEPAKTLEGADDIIKKFEKELDILKKNVLLDENNEESQSKIKFVENGVNSEKEKEDAIVKKKRKSSQFQSPQVDNEDEFIVEKILDKRSVKKRKVEYLIKWKNYNKPEDNTWEPAANITGHKNLIEDYENALSDIPVENKDIDQNSLPVEHKDGKSKQEITETNKQELLNNKMDAKSNKVEEEAQKVIQSQTAQKKKNEKPNSKKKKKVQEDVYIIESLMKKNGSKYLVKWENFSDDFNTWEPKASIPEFILKFYEDDPKRLGTPAPIECSVLDQNDQEDDYEVEKIMEKRTTKKGKVEFLVKWKNFDDPADYTWEPLTNLDAVKDLVNKFEKDLEVKLFFHF